MSESLPRRYATLEERRAGVPWCILCGCLLERGRLCDGDCLPATASPVGIQTEVQ